MEIKKFFDQKLRLFLVLSLVIWAGFYFFVYINFYHYPNAKNLRLLYGHIAAISEIALDLLMIYIIYKIYKLVDNKHKWLVFILFFSFIFLTITDLGYYLFFQILGYHKPTNLSNISYFAPFLFYLILQTIFWFSLLRKYISKGNEFLVLAILTFFGVVLMFIFVVTSNWSINYFSYTGIYELITGLIEVVLFYLAALSLICSTKRGVYLLAFSTTMIIATNFWEKYLYQLNLLNVFDYSDAFWCLALILGVFGLLYILKEKKLKIDDWVCSLHSIKSQVALSAFLLTIFTFFVIIIVGFYFNLLKKSNILSLPFIIMTYPLGTLVISNHMGNKLKSLFVNLQKNIESFTKFSRNDKTIDSDFSTEEFVTLQKFIFSLFQSEQARNEEKKILADLAKQVAHDIRSPVSAILMFSKEHLGLPESQRILIRNSANRIQNIANNLLNYNRNPATINDQIEKILIGELILSVFYEKEIEYKNLDIKFECNIDDSCSFLFVEANRIELERVTSNLLNNSVDALENRGEIKLLVIKQFENVSIKIIDNGCGISNEIKKRIQNGGKFSTKIDGHGLGMLYMKSILNKYNATYQITSEENRGTAIEIIFPICKCPAWIAKEIHLEKDSVIIILDDDPSIHVVWDKMFSVLQEKYADIKILHCRTAEQCMESIQSLSAEKQQKVIMLSDYELIHQNISGLDIIETLDINNAILVTSHYENQNIIKRAILLNTKILPKILTSDVKLHIKETDKAVKGEKIHLVIVENSIEFSEILGYLYSVKKKNLVSYADPFEFFDNLHNIDEKTKICFDYDIDLPITGIDLATKVWDKGYKNLYLATGYDLDQSKLPNYLKLLRNKMDLLNL